MDTTYTNHDGDICRDDYEHATKTGRYAQPDTITLDVAGEIDAAWTNAGMPHDGLRIYGLRRSGNRTMTFLGAPSLNGSAPTYVLSNGKYLHLSGPTLADWYAEQDAADLADTQRMAF